METGKPTEHSKQLTTRSQTETQRAERLGWIIDQLSMAAVAKGQVFTTERLRINAEDLIDIPQDALAMAFVRARRELDFVPGVAELRRLAQVDESGKLNAEMRAAWDTVTKFVGKWGRWNNERDRAYIEAGAPILPQRIIDTVRRSGTWTAYLAMDADSFPFQQKRFFEEYTAWEMTEMSLSTITANLQLPEKPMKALVKSMGMEEVKPQGPISERVVSEITPEEWESRRAQAKQQLADWQAKREA